MSAVFFRSLVQEAGSPGIGYDNGLFPPPLCGLLAAVVYGFLKGVNRISLVVRSALNATGAITFTGNTLGLSRSGTAGVPGTQDSIGAFITTNTASVFGSYPAGTTSQFQSNSSAANLNLPSGSTVVYAELIWGGSYINGNVNLSASINNPVSFTLPNGGTFSVSPDSATSATVNLGNGAFAYVRSANVTSLVQQGGAGRYVTGGVVGTLVIQGDPTANHAGWTLGVIYSNPALPFRNMSLRVGAALVESTSAAVTTTITGFGTPVSGATDGRALFSAQEGSANRSGDRVLFGPTAAQLAALSGPNNFANNFFASQINNDAGQLDTTGTFGSRNQINGSPGTNIPGGRQGWDITNVGLSSHLANSQNSAVLALTTSGEAFIVNANAVQIDINAPRINLVKTASASGAIAGDVITYTVTISNTGTAGAISAVLSDLPSGSVFVPGSVTVAGVNRPSADITAGISLGTQTPGSSTLVTYQTRVVTVPGPQTASNTANLSFTFQSLAGGPVIPAVIPSNTVSLPVYSPQLAVAKSADRSAVLVGNTVTYTLLVTNNGNIGATVTVTDNIPAGSTLVPGSVTVNGTPSAGSPVTGIAAGTVPAGGTATVRFQTVVNSLPAPPQLTDQAAATFTFLTPDGRTVPGSAVSNPLTLPVSLPNVTVQKTAGSLEAAVGDVFTYTAAVANGGGSALSNVILSDPLPDGAVFVPGSVTVAGSPRPQDQPDTGITVGTLAPGASASIQFQVRVVSLPASANLVNRASVSYSSGALTGTALSNTTATAVYQALVDVAKSAGTAEAAVGAAVVYTLTVRNTGNRSAQTVLTDTIPGGTAFTAGSVTVNGTPRPSDSPVSGINLGAIEPGGIRTVTFQVTVQTLPGPAVLNNRGQAAYTYSLPSGRVIQRTADSNLVSLPVSAPNISLGKSASVQTAGLGETLTYTITLSNTGNAPAANTLLSDPVPAGAEFVPGSVSVNGNPRPDANPLAGIALGTVPAGSTYTIAFAVRTVSLPPEGELRNRAAVSYTAGTFTGSSFSNTVLTPVFAPLIELVKTASVQTASVGNTFTYTVSIRNTGNIAAMLNLTDLLPPEAVFAANSVQIGGIPLPGYQPDTGIPVGPLAGGDAVDVSFVVQVPSLPPSQQLVNQAAAAYRYTLPDGRELTGSAGSAPLTVPGSAPNAALVKTVSPSAAVNGDTLRFSLTVTNTGVAPVSNVVVSDPLFPGLSLLSGSVTVNGESRPAASPTAGIPIGSLAPGASAAVTFEVIIAMPIPTQISNQASVSFTSGTFTGSSASNVTVTPVTQPQISVVKRASTAVATLGDTIVYTFTIANSGNLEASVGLLDTVPAGTAFVPNSIIVNGASRPGITPGTGIPIGIVAPGAAVTASFSVVVESIPSPQFASNQATANFTYSPPDGRLLSGTVLSNTVTVPISAPNITVAKSTATTAAAVGETVTFNVNVTNNGIGAVTGAVLSDPLPQGSSFVPSSVTINGVPSPSLQPSSGIPLGTLPPNSTVLVSYAVRVDSIPANGRLTNTAAVSFSAGAFAGTSLSNTVNVPVFQPVVSASKRADTSAATVGDTIVYTLTFSNSGNFPAQLTVTDTLPAGTSFVPNSVLLNGFPLPQANPATGIPAGTLAPGGVTSVVFSVLVESLPSPQTLTNQGTGAFSFTLPDGRTLGGAAFTNTVSIPVSAPNVSVSKTSSASAAAPGDVITYTASVTNSGIAAITSAVFTDPLPSGSAFVSGSVTVDGESRTEANPATGVPLGTIPPGDTVTISFNVSVTGVPASGQLTNQSSVSFTSGAFSGSAFSNTVSTPVFQPVITAVKTAGTQNATVGDTLSFTVTVTNSGNIAALVSVTDPIPAGTSLVPNSVLLNGLPVPGADPSAGVFLGTLAPSASAELTFSVVIESLPPGQLISNQASISFSFTLPGGRTVTGSAVSNTATVQVSAPDVTLVKTASIASAVVGDSVNYTVTVTNDGIAPVDNVVFSDPLPALAAFVPGSVSVNGSPLSGANPETGFAVGTIAPGGTATIRFSVIVTGLPDPASLSNRASVSFTSGAFSAVSYSNTLVTPVFQPIITLQKLADTANVTVGNTVNYTVTVANSGNLPAVVTVFDPPPTGASFVENSVLVNGVPQPGADPSAGILIGTVQPGQTQTVAVTLIAAVESLPTPQQLVNQASATFTFTPPDGRQLTGSAVSNVVTIPVSSPDVSVVKSTTAVDAVVGDIITYRNVVTNNGIDPVTGVVLVDPIPAGSEFISGSVVVDDVPRQSASPAAGIPIGTLAPGASSVVTFQVRVVETPPSAT